MADMTITDYKAARMVLATQQLEEMLKTPLEAIQPKDWIDLYGQGVLAVLKEHCCDPRLVQAVAEFMRNPGT